MRSNLLTLAACRRLHALLTEERGVRRGSPKGTASGGANLTAAAGWDSPTKALLDLRGVGVDDGGGGGAVVDDGGGSRPSAIMTRDASTRRKTPRISQPAGGGCRA